MEKLIKEVSKKFDKEFDFKKIIGGWSGVAVEIFDSNIIQAGLTFAFYKLPTNFHDEFKMVLEAYLNDDYTAIKTESITFINEQLDIPYLNEEDEAVIIGSISKAIFTILKSRR